MKYIRVLSIISFLIIFSPMVGLTSLDVEFAYTIGSSITYTPSAGLNYRYEITGENTTHWTVGMFSGTSQVSDMDSFVPKTATNNVFEGWDYWIDPMGLAIGDILNILGSDFEIVSEESKTTDAGTFTTFKMTAGDKTRFHDKESGLAVFLSVDLGGGNSFTETLTEINAGGSGGTTTTLGGSDTSTNDSEQESSTTSAGKQTEEDSSSPGFLFSILAIFPLIVFYRKNKL